MTSLAEAAADYLRIRRALGFKLERAEKLLAQYSLISTRPASTA